MTKLSVAILLLSLYVASVVSAEECLECTNKASDEEAGKKLASKIPGAFYAKLKKICEDIDKFVKCLIGKGALTDAEAKELVACFAANQACETMPDPKAKDDFKAFLQRLASIKAIACRLSKIASKVSALMQCTKAK